MLPIKYILLLITVHLLTSLGVTKVCKESLLVCYGRINPYQISGYDIVILEADWYTEYEIGLMKKYNKKLICYLSVGEVSAHAPYYDKLAKHVHDKNHHWNSYYLNLNKKQVTKTLHDVLNKRLAKGFDGVFLDNVDTFSEFGKYPEQQNKYVDLVKSIKRLHPNSYLIQNSGVGILPQSHQFIDAVAMESVVSNYHFDTGKYSLRPKDVIQHKLNKIKQVFTQYKKPVLVIEYAISLENYKQIKKTIKHCKCSYYYVSSIDLQKVSALSKK